MLILYPESLLGQPSSLCLLTSDDTRSNNSTILFPKALEQWATENQDPLIKAALASKILALAVDILPPDSSKPSQACWSLWSGRSPDQLEFSYNLALETGVPVRIVPSEQLPPGMLPLSLLTPEKAPLAEISSNVPIMATSTSSLFKPKPSRTKDETKSNLSVLAAFGDKSGKGTDGLGGKDEKFGAYEGGGDQKKHANRDDNGRKEQGNDKTEKEKDTIGDASAKEIDELEQKKATVTFEELPQPGFGVSSTITHNVAVWTTRAGMTATSQVKLKHLRSKRYHLQAAFIRITGPEIMRTFHSSCENPLPLGTDKHGSKAATTRTFGLTGGLNAAAPVINAALTLVKAVEESHERQFPPNTTFISELWDTDTRSDIFRVTPRLASELPGPLEVTLTSHIRFHDPSRKPIDSFDLMVNVQWHILEIRHGKLAVFFALLHHATENILKKWPESDSKSTYSTTYWKGCSDDGAANLEMPTLVEAADVKAAGVKVDLELRLRPKTSSVFQFFQNVTRRFRRSKVYRRHMYSFEMTGRAGWMPMEVERGPSQDVE
ncbi:hypothetical protein C8J56DRAFT_1167141 [Mycena floridula]|nr:hypothetical protein C8J56DRAFT_1167141 [Mycena floridula]